MPKYCSAPNCKNDSGNTTTEKKSFYKFPLHDPTRLQNWLKNMDRDDWTPSRHQYLCHEHFLPSCFTVRWGIRYLDNNAVPTIFDLSDNKAKRKGVDHFERRAKRKRSSSGVEKPTSQAPVPDAEAPSTACSSPDTSTVQVYTIAVTPAKPGDQVLQLDPGNLHNVLGGPVLEAAPASSGDFPVTIRPTVTRGLGISADDEPREVVVVMEAPVDEMGPSMIVGDMMCEAQRTGPAAATAVVATPGYQTSLEDPTLTTDSMYTIELGELGEVIEADMVEHHAEEVYNEEEEEDDDDNEDEECGSSIPLIAYFETIPNVLPTGPTTLVNISPDTVMSSSLGSRPIVSTVPIVSKHVPTSTPDSLILTLERLKDEPDDGEELSENSVELQGKRLEEHRYHKSSLSKEQLEAIVLELQKKVRVLQQRHRRHLDKLQGLETTVGQLRQTNLVNEERLQLLERAYLETSTITEEGETLAIIYGDDNTTYLYAQPKTEDEEVGHIL